MYIEKENSYTLILAGLIRFERENPQLSNLHIPTLIA